MNYLNEKYDLSDFTYFANKKYVRSEVPSVERIRNAVVLPDLDKVSADENDETSTATSPLTVVYLGCISTAHYGNVLFDFISRLWWQEKNANNYPWVFVAPKHIKTPPLLYKLVELIGIKRDDLMRITTPTRFAEVIVPQKTFIHDRYIMPEYATIYNRIYEAMQPKEIPTYDKIYLTRRNLKRKKEIGEWRFEKFFAANGYQIIAPEKMRLEEQAYLLRHCKSIASLEGSHAHGVVWTKVNDGGKQIILRKQSEVIPRQLMFNRLWNREILYVDIFEEPFKGFPISHDRGPFLLRWTKEMEQYAKDNGMIVPASCRYGYWIDWIEYSLKCVIYKLWHTLKHTFR